MKNSNSDQVQLAPDRCTKYRVSSVPSATEIANWCHPQRATKANNDWASGFAPQQRPLPKRLVGVWAHPDDEAYLSAGLMARVVGAGGSVTIVTLTDGEGGFPAEDHRPAHIRARQRRAELRAAMASIGVYDVRFVGVADGGVSTSIHDDPRGVDRIGPARSPA